MSGFEVVGLILAVVPLVLQGLEAYPKTKIYKSTASFARARQERRTFARKLLILHTELRFVMIDVLKPLNPSLTPQQREVITGNDSVGSNFFNVWEQVSKADPEAVEKAYRSTIDHITPVLHDMVAMLTEMLQHSDISYDAGRDVLKGVINDHSDGTLSITKNFAKRFKFAKSDPRRYELLEQMRENIKFLKTLVKGQEKVTTFVADGESIEQSHVPFLDTVRRYSHNLHEALSTMWRCTCHREPSALLRLERWESPEQKASELRFSLVLTFEHSSDDQAGWGFRETAVCITHKFVSCVLDPDLLGRRRRSDMRSTKSAPPMKRLLNAW